MKSILLYIASFVVVLWICHSCSTAKQSTDGTTQDLPPTVEELLGDTVVAAIDSMAQVVADSVKSAAADSIISRLQEQRLASDTAAVMAADSTKAVANDSTSVARADTLRQRSRFVMTMVDLDNPVQFSTKDSLVFYGRNNVSMYGDGDVTYGDINLKSMQIDMNMDNSEVYAVGRPDSTGEVNGLPVFTDRSGEYESKTMRYNFKTKKGFITEVVTQQGEGYLTGGQTKKMENDEYFIKEGRYTTCDNHEHPHFYLQLTKAKVRPKKDIVMGPAYMVLADVPLPLAIPFGFFPFSEDYSSGIIMPTFGDDYNRGYYLKDGGYYFAINDKIDLALTGEIYTKGSWGVAAQSTYKKRYKFSGSFNMSFLTTITGEKGEPDYSKQNNFKLAWTHSQDSKANPNMTFSASVNFATSGYSRNNLDDYYSNSFTENTTSSSVNMTYRFPNSKWSLSASANISQRSSDSTLTVSFPNITLTMSQTAPFKRKKAVGEEKWYEKIKMSYTGVFQNSLTAGQNEFFKKSLIKDWRNGMRHTIPISATFNVFDYINVTPSVSINDRMYTSKIRQQWDPAASAVVRDTTYSFYNIFDFSASVSLDTKIYGFFKPWKIFGDKVQMIRHVLTPTISFTGAPDFSSPFWGYYGTYAYTNPTTGKLVNTKYSYFAHGIFGSVGEGKTGSVSLSLANNVEMKVKSDADSTGVKKISLIENFTVSQSYNFAADSLRWSNINTSLSLRLMKNFNLNLSATWDVYTYQLNEYGTPTRVNRTRLQAGKGLAKLSSTGTSFSYTLNNDTFKKKKDKEEKLQDEPPEAVDRYRRNEREEENKGGRTESGIELNPDGYAKWEFPWSLTLNYSVNYSYGDFNYEKMDYNGRITQNLSLSGNVKPTKNWAFNFSASYNFDTGKIAYMNCSISRDLHCFTMTASFVPVGPYKSYNFHIAVKSSLLSDLKYDKRSSSSTGVTWY
ncbi:MAG TPA: LPS-assembly protein LptD [Candidatus Avimuribaculum pullicola]|nr:LPS-assembly protein LptD [Candidatus Avimuribaculum pullicola]